MLKGVGLVRESQEDQFFGPKSVNRIPYRQIAREWENRKRLLLPCCR